MKYKFLILGILLNLVVFAQTSSSNKSDNTDNPKENLFRIKGSFGPTLMSNNSISSIYGIGFSGNLGFQVNLLHNKLFFCPEIQTNRFVKYSNASTSDNLTINSWKISLSYQLLEQKDIKFSAFFGIGSGNVNNTLKPRSGYQGSSIKIMEGSNLGLNLGLQSDYKNFFITGQYQSFRPNVSVTKYITDNINDRTGVYDPFTVKDKTLDLSHFTILIGYSYKLL